jgi:ferrous iron transport protein A
MPLAMVSYGELKQVSSLRATGDVKQRLTELGFIPGSTVRVVGENDSGLILIVKDTRLAINRGLAQKIMVQ